MVKLTAQEKESAKQAQEIEALLRASANSATKVIDDWFDSDGSDTDGAAPLKARDVFQGRPARVGVGAKFLSHREMHQNNSTSAIGGVNPLTREELALKRKLTATRNNKNNNSTSVGSSKSSISGGNRKERDSINEVDGSDSESESRSNMVGKSKRPSIQDQTVSSQKKKKKSKSSAFLDTLIQRRRR